MSEVKETVTNWLNELAAVFYDEDIVRLAQRLHKCLNHNGDYVKNKHVIPFGAEPSVFSSAVKKLKN
jgi:hypothetical protein